MGYQLEATRSFTCFCLPIGSRHNQSLGEGRSRKLDARSKKNFRAGRRCAYSAAAGHRHEPQGAIWYRARELGVSLVVGDVRGGNIDTRITRTDRLVDPLLERLKDTNEK